MATDVAAFRAAVQRERNEVATAIAAIDVPFEEARFQNAAATFQAAENTFNKAQRRWALLQDKQNRLIVLDAQIALLTP